MTGLKRGIAVLSLGFAMAACGSSSSSGTTGSTCTGSYACTNGACACSGGGHDGSSCCDPSDSSCTTNKCDTYCKTCT